jgi:hypothetical protein
VAPRIGGGWRERPSELRKAKLKRNALVTVRVSKPGYISAVFRFTIRIRKDPVKKTLCSPPGTTKTQKTCS